LPLLLVTVTVCRCRFGCCRCCWAVNVVITS
jgi:hypothetical protein